MYLYNFDSFTNTSEGSTPTGYSRELFQNKIIPLALQTAKLKDPKALRTALIHQYGDWTNPNDEITILSKAVDIMSDTQFNAAAIRSAMVHSDTAEEGQLYFYVFDHKGVMTDPRLTGASHADDVAIVLGFPASFVEFYTMFGLNISKTEFTLSRKVMEYWTNFAKTGDPNTGDTPSNLTTWPEYNTKTQKYIRFRGDLEDFPIEDHYAASRVNFWHNLIPVMSQECDKVCPKCADRVSSATSLKMTLTLTAFLLNVKWL